MSANVRVANVRVGLCAGGYPRGYPRAICGAILGAIRALSARLAARYLVGYPARLSALVRASAAALSPIARLPLVLPLWRMCGAEGLPPDSLGGSYRPGGRAQ